MTDMTIRDIRTTRLRMPWPEDAWMDGHALGPHRDLLVVEIETAGGLVGMGYLNPLAPVLRTLECCLHETLKDRIIGRDATEVEGIWADLYRATTTVGRAGIAVMAASAIDIALWDLVGKRAGLPLHRLWGHVRSEVPAYGSGCWRGSHGEGMIAKAQHYIAKGFKAIKMQVAHVHDLRTDLDNVRRMREAVGPDIDIMIDVNMGWTADVAIQMGRKFEAYDVYWLEEPVPADDFSGYLRIAAALDLRIVGGETHFTRFDLRPFLEASCLPILQPDPMRGGLTELRKIAVLADTWGMKMAPHLFPELNIHVLASIPNALWAEQMGLLDDLWIDPPVVEAGMLQAPERPGHGLAFRPEVVQEFRQR